MTYENRDKRTGIAGPTLAYWLRWFGHEPVLFEKSPVLRTGGYVIDFWGLGLESPTAWASGRLCWNRWYKMDRLSMVDGDGVTIFQERTRASAKDGLFGNRIPLLKSL